MSNESKHLIIRAVSSAAGNPLYQQIVDGIKNEIVEGRLAVGTRLPSFRRFAEDLQVSVITVKRAYEELEREGIIYRRQGLGTFVGEQGAARSRVAKLGAAREFLRRGFQEGAEAGLNREELAELAEEILKETHPT